MQLQEKTILVSKKDVKNWGMTVSVLHRTFPNSLKKEKTLQTNVSFKGSKKQTLKKTCQVN
jgi:hypothetical protein